MPHHTELIATISIGLGLAFIFGFVASRFKLPPLVGYLIAGVVVGPFTPGFVADSGLANQLAEIGVMLLMFGVGLHFSMRDLMAVRKIAVPGAVAQIAVATALGATVAVWWGWTWGQGIVFGLSLSVASTVVLLRALEERGLLDSINGRIAVGWLIVEDLAMVLALVLLPALAVPLGGTASTDPNAATSIGTAITTTLLKVSLFIGLMLFVGIRLIPWLLAQVARTGSRELFTLAVLAAALGIAFGAGALFGVSYALGAFFAGVVISESDLSHQAAAEALPLQDAFAVLFFVSVGMLFDPSVLIRNPLAVLKVVLIIVVGKSVAAFLIVVLFRYPIRTALIVSASLAQIGEFSFILAGLGMSLGLLPAEGNSLILAGAILSITLNPVAFQAVPAIERYIMKRPLLTRLFDRPRGDALESPDPATESRLHGHAVIIGFGRVGSTIGQALDREGTPYVVVEQNREVVEDLRARDVPALYGDASRPGLLDHVHLEDAKVLVVAAPGAYQVRQIVELARRVNPSIDIVARSHSEGEQQFLERQGVGLAVMGERELALSMARHVLTSTGCVPERAELLVRALRTAGDVVASPSGRTE